MQMHHTAIELRQIMPQSDFRHALGLMMADMEAAAKSGKGSINFPNGTHGVDDMTAWATTDDQTCRAGRIAAELKRLGYTISYGILHSAPIMPREDYTYQMVVKW